MSYEVLIRGEFVERIYNMVKSQTPSASSTYVN
jgi:hypothetical protein